MLRNYNVRVSEDLIGVMKPHFKGDTALTLWMEQVLRDAMAEYANQAMVSATADDDMLNKLSTLEANPQGFLMLDSILPPAKSTLAELRAEAYTEKYGI